MVAPLASASLTVAQWEALCRRCGRCCYEKLLYRGRVYYTDRACPQLDPVSRRCRVYESRRQRQPDCAVLDEALVAQGFLPLDCPYVVRQFGPDPVAGGYPAPVVADQTRPVRPGRSARSGRRRGQGPAGR